MFKISEFSRFTRVSVKMLRHYDELGLLKPASIDRYTGYRYYSSDQLPRLNRIIALKDLGFSLEQIGKLLTEDLSPEEIRGMFRQRRLEIEEQLKAEQTRLTQIENRLRVLEQNPRHPNYDVIIRQVPPQLVASIRKTVPDLEESVQGLFEELEAYVAGYLARSPSSPMTLYHDTEYREEAADVEAAVPLTKWIAGNERIKVREIPGVAKMACAVYLGDYERLDDVLNTLMVWIEANQYQSAGPLREVYLRFGADDPQALNLPAVFLAEQAELFVTEIQLPVEKLSIDRTRRLIMENTSAATKFSHIGQIAIPVHDLKQAIAFYRDTLGLQYLMEIARAAFFDCGGVRLMLSMPEKPEFDHPASIIYYKVEDIQAAYELLLSRGVRFDDEPHLIAHMHDHDLWMAFFRDPDNNLLGMMSEVPLTKS